MKRILITISLILYSLIALPAPASGTDAAPPACPLQGDHVVALAQTFLLGWNQEQSRLGPFPASIPAGRYELTVASWDDHSDKPSQDDEQPNEIWYLSAHGGGSEIARSTTTPDVPGGQDLLVSSLGTIDLIGDVDSLTVHHGFFDAYNPNSVVPLCVALTTVTASPVVATVVSAPVVENGAAAASQPVASHTAPVEAAPVAASAAPESLNVASSRGIVPAQVSPRNQIPMAVVNSRTERPAAALTEVGVMGIRAQLTELPDTGIHSSLAGAGLVALALGMMLLRLGRNPAASEL